MRAAWKGLFAFAAVAILAGAARAAEVPNFNKRGTGEKEEKAFVEEVARTIVNEARTSAKDVTLQEYKFTDRGAGRKELKISAGYKGAVTTTKYTADITVSLDTSKRDKWEVLKIDYTDNNKNLVGFSRKRVDALVEKFNAAAK
jgi:hypothetical protein